MTLEKTKDFFCATAKKIFLCIQIFIVLLVLMEFGRYAVDVFPLHYQLPNSWLALIGLGTILLLFLMIYCARNLSQIFCKKSIYIIWGIIYALIIFTAQMYLCKCIYFYTTWDVGMMQSAADVIVSGGSIQDWILQSGDEFSKNYFNAYPNNIFLTAVFAGIKNLSAFLGFTDSYFPTIVIGVLCIDVSILFTVLTVWKMTCNRKVTCLTVIISTLFLGFNPWILVPYSDVYSILFLSIIMYFYCSLKKEKKGYASWIGIGIAASIGIKIKPTVAIALFAIIIIEILGCNRHKIKELVAKAVILAGCFAVVFSLINSLNHAIYVERNPDAQMTAYHYLMMGANEETYGSYYGEDRELSWGISDPQKRKETQIEVWRQRIREKGIWGTVKFYVEKLVIANGDGSFSWKWEGNFFGEYRGLNSEFAKKLQSFYYVEDNKMMYNILQSIWMSLQILVCVFAVLFRYRKKEEIFLAITLLGINLFLMLFEVRARYLFLFIPYYITAAMLGFFYIENRIKRRTSR